MKTQKHPNNIPDFKKMALESRYNRIETALGDIQYLIHRHFLGEVDAQDALMKILTATREALDPDSE
jgi:hypothetical protein